MLKRKLGLRVKYWLAKMKYRHVVTFNGYTVCYAFPNSSINFRNSGGGKTLINSCFESNLLGLCQRSILVARYGGKITIGSGCGISGSTIYAMKELSLIHI